VGACPPRSLRDVASPHVIVTGSVADIKPYIRYADAVIAPLHMARGVQNKVLEAMAMARPVIATREATRSLAVENGNQLWVANDPTCFAEAVLAELKAPGQSQVGANGRRYVEQWHDWRMILAEFDLQLDALHYGIATPDAQHSVSTAKSMRSAHARAAQ
jgi:glycosyltransferase involved in cell wall biosynthesis